MIIRPIVHFGESPGALCDIDAKVYPAREPPRAAK
jgi:hypothetical protein